MSVLACLCLNPNPTSQILNPITVRPRWRSTACFWASKQTHDQENQNRPKPSSTHSFSYIYADSIHICMHIYTYQCTYMYTYGFMYIYTHTLNMCSCWYTYGYIHNVCMCRHTCGLHSQQYFPLSSVVYLKWNYIPNTNTLLSLHSPHLYTPGPSGFLAFGRSGLEAWHPTSFGKDERLPCGSLRK